MAGRRKYRKLQNQITRLVEGTETESLYEQRRALAGRVTFLMGLLEDIESLAKARHREPDALDAVFDGSRTQHRQGPACPKCGEACYRSRPSDFPWRCDGCDMNWRRDLSAQSQQVGDQ